MSREDKKTLKKIGAGVAIFILVMCIYGAFNSPNVENKTPLSVILLVDLSESTFPFPSPSDTLKKRILDLNMGVLERAITAVKASGQCDKISVMVFADRAIRLLPTTSFYVHVTSKEASRIENTLSACADWNYPEVRSLKRNVTDVALAFQFVDDEIGRELNYDANPAHPRLVLLISDGINDPLNENTASKTNLTNKQDIDTAVRLLKSKANVQVAMLQLPTAGRMGEYALQKDWRDILGAQYHWMPKAFEEIEAAIKHGMAHARDVNRKIIRITAQSAFTVTPDNILKGNISVAASKLERETDSLGVDAQLASIAWFSDSAKSWISLNLTTKETKRFKRKAVLWSDAEDSIGYAESLPCLKEILYDAPVQVSFKLNTDWIPTYRKPGFLLEKRLSKSTLTINESNPDTVIVNFEFRKEMNKWTWAVYVNQSCVALFYICMVLSILSFYWGGGHRREKITLTVSDPNSPEAIYPIENDDRKERLLKGRLRYIFKKLQYSDKAKASLVLWPIGYRKILVEHDILAYKTSEGKNVHIRTFLTNDPNKSECTDTHSFFDLEQSQKTIYLVFNDKLSGQASTSRCYKCDIKPESQQIRSPKWFELTSWCLDYEHHEESRCRLEKLSKVPLGAAVAFTIWQLFFAPVKPLQLFFSQGIYWLLIICGIVMYGISVTELKKPRVMSSVSIIVVTLTIIAMISDLFQFSEIILKFF